MTPNINNNLLDIPLGLSVYANCIDVLKSIDLAYDGAKVAMEIGRPRIGITNNGIITNVIEGRTYSAFDANDISIYDIGSGSKDEKVVIEDLTTPYRATEFEQSLQTQLDIFSQAIGLGDKAFKWQQGSVPTATQVISENSSMLRTMEKHQINVERAIKELIVGILDINGSNTDVDIDIKFDDSVTRDKDAERARFWQFVSAGQFPFWKYLVEFEGYTEEEAKELASEATALQPALFGVE